MIGIIYIQKQFVKAGFVEFPHLKNGLCSRRRKNERLGCMGSLGFCAFEKEIISDCTGSIGGDIGGIIDHELINACKAHKSVPNHPWRTRFTSLLSEKKNALMEKDILNLSPKVILYLWVNIYNEQVETHRR